jgi:hypothetical protein
VKWLLDGQRVDKPLPQQWREFLLCSHFGWTKQQYEEAPAAWCDWMLQFIGLYKAAGL